MRTVLKGLGILVGGVIGLVLLVYLFASAKLEAKLHHHYPFPPEPLTLSVAKADVAHGRHLATVRMECIECHGKDLAGGTVIDDPVAGHVHGSNITPFKLKTWTDAEIARTLRHGVAKDGHPLIIMPSEDYQSMSEKDMVDIIAYLRSVPAVDKPDQPSTAGPLLRIFWALGKTPVVFGVDMIDHAKPFAPAVKEAVTEEFGRYIAMNTCVGCHRTDFRGGPMPGTPPDWVVPANITQESLGTWSEADFIKTLKTGVNPGGSTLRMPMAMNIKYTAQWSETEYKAVWKFLKTVKGKPAGKDGF